MTKRARIPAPFPRLHPSVIRSLGPKLLLVTASCAALALIGGSSYVLSQFDHTPAVPASTQQPVARTVPDSAKVLGAATDQPNASTPASDSTTDHASTSTPAPANSPASTPSSASPQPLCALTCVPGLSLPATAVTPPAFDLVIDSGAISRGLASLYIPFHVVRHGGLATPIQLGAVSITSGGSLTNLLRVSSVTMLSPDRGALTLLTIGLPSNGVSISLNGSSGGYTASTTFSYHF